MRADGRPLAASIPLSILSSIIVLYFMGHTLNTMTLTGCAVPA
jgi:multidrug efflux pump subunit AcrB